jgi:hypothetical protein
MHVWVGCVPCRLLPRRPTSPPPPPVAQTPPHTHHPTPPPKTKTQAGGGAGSGVLTNQVEANARAGSTYDAYGTVARTRAVGAADAEMRTALGGIDQQTYIQQAAAARESAFVATRLAQGSAAVTARGDGKDIMANENRASLASMDAASAVQVRAGSVRVVRGGLGFGGLGCGWGFEVCVGWGQGCCSNDLSWPTQQTPPPRPARW